MPRDLKLPDGWRFSSLRKIRLRPKCQPSSMVSLACNKNQPAAFDNAADSTVGVEIHGEGGKGKVPIGKISGPQRLFWWIIFESRRHQFFRNV